MIGSYRGETPRFGPSAFAAGTAVVVGDVEIGPDASVWFNVVMRGDVSPIHTGASTNASAKPRRQP